MDQDALPTGGDVVDRMQRDWARLRPDLSFTSLGVIHRMLRASRLILEASDAFLADYGLTRGELDVLSALRRSGEPLSPTTLAQTLLAPRSAITMRLNALQARGLLSRSANPTDRRSSLLALTDTGAALVDEVIPGQLALEDALLDKAPARSLEGLADRLRALTAAWEQGRSRHAGASGPTDSTTDRHPRGSRPDLPAGGPDLPAGEKSDAPAEPSAPGRPRRDHPRRIAASFLI